MTKNLKSTKSSRERMRKYRKKKKMRRDYEHCVEREMNNFRSQFEETENVYNDNHSTDEQFDLKEELRLWAINHRITHAAISDLLKLLIFAGITCLPRDSRTFMQTPKHVDIKQMGTGKFWYRGIQKVILCLFSKIKKGLVLTLDFNFDGMQLFNSSKTEFWPMLCAIQGKKQRLVLDSRVYDFVFISN